jgi:hypothetical protein
VADPGGHFTSKKIKGEKGRRERRRKGERRRKKRGYYCRGKGSILLN